ncbi:MAG: molybdopterin-dependent oxidoreductase [Verrucomicrobia bacterium]|nr:molybdopterin-dependent oxidoreductase [Verrucomicrobiota bacterium]
MPELSRRRFLKISSASIVTAGAAGSSLAALARTSGATGESGLRQVPTFCDICFWKCGCIATVREGRLWKLEGNPLDPLCRGRLCPRGTGGVGALTDPDRLRTPLIRTQERGAEKWKEATWEEALTHIAEKMKKIAATHGPEAMALFSHGIGGTFLKHTLKAFGSPNIAAPSFAQCRGPRDVGFRLTFGEDIGSPERTDIENAQCLVLIGSHLGENMHNTQVQEFATAVGRGASLIVVDPRFSVAAGKAKYYLPIKPGTDLALILAWMNVLVTEKLYDVEYVTKHGHGFEAFVAALAPWTPEWAYPETGINPALIRATAREMARYRPATLVHPGRHTNWYGDDAQRSRALALLNALLGSWGRKGGFYAPSTMAVPDYPYPEYPKAKRPKVDNPDHKYRFAHETLTTGIREATLTGQPYPIKGWLVYATNLLQALPSEAETIRAIQQLDLLVVIDVVPSETAGWADVVLPESTYLERHDELNVEVFKEPFVALRQPVIASPHDQKPNWWIARQLAVKLGLESYYPWKDIEEYLGARVKEAGLDFAELKKHGLIRGPREPLYFEDGAPAEFGTPSGKIEFYSNQLQQAGFDPVPKFTRPEAGPPGSFRLLFGRAPVHTFSRTHTNRVLSDMMSENAVWVNAAAARRLGLKSGDRVRLRNQDGVLSHAVGVKATERIRPDCVYLVHGFGHTARGLRHAFGKGASDAQLITRYKVDPLMGGTAMNVNFVTLEPAERA